MNKKSTYAVILETSYRLFAEHGFEKTSMAMISKELGISKPALYYHFPSKEAIIEVLFEEICQSIGFGSFFNVEKYTKDNFIELLILDGLGMINNQLDDNYYARIMNQYQALGYRNTKYSQKLVSILEEFTSGFNDLLQRGISMGAMTDRDTLAGAQILTMIVDSVDNFMSYGLDYNYEDIWTKAVKSIVMEDM